MRLSHPRPTAPRLRALRTGLPLAVLALASLLLAASCTDDVAANCPPLSHPEVLTVAAAAGNPCAPRVGSRARCGR